VADKRITVRIGARDSATAVLKKFRREVNTTGSRLRQLGSVFKKLAIVAAALTAAIAAIGVKLVKIGATVIATRNRFETVFGDSVESVREFNEEFAKISGLSKQAFQDIVARTGAIAQGMGFAQDASARFAVEIVKVAADLSSFNDIPTAEAALAVNSALTGERESLKRLGIVLLETDVQQRALADTGKTVAKSLTQQEKATATLRLITERAGVAMGDASRTANDLDRVLQRVAASFKDVRDRVAEFVARSPLINEFLRKLTDLFTDMATILSSRADLVREMFAQLGAIAGAAFGGGMASALAVFFEQIDLRDTFGAFFRKLADMEAEIIGQSLTIIKGVAAEAAAEIEALRRQAAQIGAADIAAALEPIERPGVVPPIRRPPAPTTGRGELPALVFPPEVPLPSPRIPVPEAEFRPPERVRRGFLPPPSEAIEEWKDEFTKNIVDMGKEAKELLFGVGEDMITGLIQGTLKMGDVLKTFLIGFVSRFILGPFAEFLGIRSPSAVFAEYGKQAAMGFTVGMDSWLPAALRCSD
jgi:hypothetical protein